MTSWSQCCRLSGETGTTASPSPAVCAALHTDVLFEVLLRLTGKELCRLRAVCRSWRALTSDPTFVAAHAAHHPGLLLVGGVLDFDSFPSVDILLMDLSGSVVKRIRHSGTHFVLPTHLDLVCVTEAYSCKATLLNPVTAAVHTLPVNLSTSHSRRRALSDYDGSFNYGRDSDGEYKVLRVLTDHHHMECPEQLFEILTLNESGHMRWRAKKALPMCVRTDAIASVVVKGVVHFLLGGRPNGSNDPPEHEMDFMALFDLKTEKWVSYLQGPISSHPEMNSIDDILPEPYVIHVYQNLSLSELNDVLVVAQHTDYRDAHIDSFIDLWYLTDSEKHIWERKYRIGLGMTIRDTEHFFARTHPSLILDDGRILVCISVARSNSQGQYTRRVV